MKKLMIVTLALLMALNFCACGDSGDSDDSDSPKASDETAATPEHPVQSDEAENLTDEMTQSMPTEEDEQMLRDYAMFLDALSTYGEYGYFSISFENNTYEASEALGVIYQQLQNMEAIDKWLEKPGYMVENYHVSEENFCTRQELLSRFSMIRDVCLGAVGENTDQLGNRRDVCALYVFRNRDGRFIRVRQNRTDAFMSSLGILFDQQLWGNVKEMEILRRAGIAVAYDQEFIYDAGGRLVTLKNCEYLADGSSNPDATVVSLLNFTYDEAGRRASVEYVQSNNVPKTVEYRYDEQGSLHVEPESSYVGSNYTYDVIYDEQGRIQKETFQELFSYNNQPTRVETASYTYDSQGNLETMVYHDSQGTFIGTREQENVYHYHYDAQGRLISVSVQQGASITNGEVYDVDETIEVTFLWGDYYFYQA